jgi:hypothetical protein
MADHRSEDRKRILPQLQSCAQTLIELAATSQIMLAQMQLWNGAQLDDFGGTKEATAQPRLDETAAGIAAATALFSALDKPTPGFETLTVKQALLRIAKR